MDEAVAGHANRIEVELHADHSVTIRDNGRGIPIDPHPKFPGKSALEVILCTLHAGGKFSGKAYQTSGGLHGVGISVVNALSDHVRVEVARDRKLFAQEFSRGLPQGPVSPEGAAPNRRGTSVTFHPDADIFGKLIFKPARLLKMVRSKAYLFSGVEIRWKSQIDDGETPTEQEKETARKSATKKLRLPGKLVDCSATNRDGTELFIVEGDSAGGSAKMARDRKTQALLPLRGKILNVLGAASSKLGTNAEISDLCQALGVGMGTRFNVDDLRYDKVIIMTDADVDGAHIAALLMTFFFTQMRPMIDAGHLYLACPPLFRLTQGANRVYCLDEPERDSWMAKGLGGRGKIDVSRFKGLGEMDAKDLKDTTMNPATRKLIRVSIDEDVPGETGDLVERLMGKKPEKRFEYIQENARFVEELDV
ncbi:UNVERIFIED_CONTAM: hypothetical protein GTU68_022053 [Idotea baltica]|nr:hypothetical protein [Idotea baltica]